jgi:hypothetical protein
MSVYDKEAFNERVNYAQACILIGTESRTFDTCFEMNDGEVVAVALFRRSLNNPALAAKLFTRLSERSVMQDVETYREVPTRRLKEEAARLRASFESGKEN